MKMLHIAPLLVLGLAGCATVKPPPTVERVDLPRFMGDWYVIAGQFTPFEKGAHNAIENYRLDEKGRIPTTFSFNKGALDGPRKTFTSMAFVHDQETKAEWRIQFFWPFRFPYLIVFLDDEYQATAVATDDRKYVWVMARSPELCPALRKRLLDHLTGIGFDTGKFTWVPHGSPAP
ncbi:MAG TPA: lipocalin family protein [Kiritimatiellia bacterium]|nr:lipocalin family protein [Kiritimatiellia bacterium]